MACFRMSCRAWVSMWEIAELAYASMLTRLVFINYKVSKIQPANVKLS
jgi:hypothetical protein